MFCLIKLIVILISISTVYSINCYQCNSSSNTDCNELFDSEETNLKPLPCDVYEARYCIKTTGIYGGLMGTNRFCASRDFGNYCEYIKRSGDKREQRSCVFTCSRDGCNNTSTIKLNFIYLYLLFIIILFIN